MKDCSLKINSLPFNNYFSNANVLQNGVNALLKNGFKKPAVFCQKAQKLVHFGLYDLVQILLVSPKTYQIVYGET